MATNQEGMQSWWQEGSGEACGSTRQGAVVVETAENRDVQTDRGRTRQEKMRHKNQHGANKNKQWSIMTPFKEMSEWGTMKISIVQIRINNNHVICNDLAKFS
jgi:hypothetical protein